MSRSLPVALMLAALFLAVAAPAHAYLITVNFFVHGAPDDATYGNETGSGSFSFDSSLIPTPPPNAISIPDGLNISALSFNWAGSTWTTANADAALLSTNNTGALNSWLIGGDLYGIGNISGDTSDFIVMPSIFFYSYGEGYTYLGTVTSWSATTESAPEPETLALLAPGLLALGLIRRRRG